MNTMATTTPAPEISQPPVVRITPPARWGAFLSPNCGSIASFCISMCGGNLVSAKSRLS